MKHGCEFEACLQTKDPDVPKIVGDQPVWHRLSDTVTYMFYLLEWRSVEQAGWMLIRLHLTRLGLAIALLLE